MLRKISLLTLTLIITVLIMSEANGANEPRAIESKETYERVMASLEDTFILDVRTAAEYEFVGHPDLPNGVANIPYKFYPTWETNPNFLRDVEARYKKTDTIIVICRSGARALIVARMLIEAGFTDSLYMPDSFEGQTDNEGHRTLNGWKVDGLPYTYSIDPEFAYKGERP